MKLFVAHKMTRNNTLNKVHVAATDRVWRDNRTKSLSDFVRLYCQLKTLLFEVEGARAHRWGVGRVPQCPMIAGDANRQVG